MKVLLVRCTSPLKYLKALQTPLLFNLTCHTFRPIIGIERPSNLACLASVLIQNKLECDILDLGTVLPNKKINIFKKYLDNNYDIIGFSFLTMFYNDVMLLAKIAKESIPRVKIVLGGPHASFDHNLIKNSFVDYIIVSEGERALVDLASGKPLKHIPNLIYKKNGRIIKNSTKLIKNLDSLPFPLREKCKPIHFRYWKYEEMQIMRGCNNKCSFCLAHRMFPGLRFRSPKNIIEEIKKLIDNGITKFRFIQSNFTAYKPFTLKLCDEIKKERLNIKFWVDACIETTDTQSLKVLKESGCIGVNFGLESLDTNYLRYTKKVKYTSYYHKKCFKLIDFCKKIGLGYTLYYMIGFPGQTKNEIDKQLKFLKKYHIWNYVYVPFLGTLEYERVKNDIVENDYSKYDCVHQVIKTKIPDNYIKKIIIYQYINSLIGYLLDKLRME